MFMPAHSREQGSLAHGSQGSWPHSQGKPHQGYGWGMHQAILAEEGILKSSIQSPCPMSCWMSDYLRMHHFIPTQQLPGLAEKSQESAVVCFTLPWQLRWAGTRLPRILLPLWFQEKLGQKRNLHGMWKTEVKQQRSLPGVSHDRM